LAKTEEALEKIIWAWKLWDPTDTCPVYWELDNNIIVKFIHKTRHLDFKKFLVKYDGLSPRKQPSKRSPGKMDFYCYVNKLLTPGLLDERRGSLQRQSSLDDVVRELDKAQTLRKKKDKMMMKKTTHMMKNKS
jgi:hypothetical protein